MFLKHPDGTPDYHGTASTYLLLSLSSTILAAWIVLALDEKVSGRGVLALLTSAMGG